MTTHAPTEPLPTPCPNCLVGASVHAKFSENLSVVLAGGTWILLAPPGHKDDIIATLGSTRPTADPAPAGAPSGGPITDADPAQLSAESAWLDLVAENFSWATSLDPIGYWSVIEEMISAGYDPHGPDAPEIWAFDHAARALAPALP